jgi:hypothetical protein
MRTLMSCIALVALVSMVAQAQNAEPSAKNAITDTMIINSFGGRLAKMFAQFGMPKDLRPKRGSEPAKDEVLCHYGAFGFRVRDKIIQSCFLWKEWERPIRGIKFDDSREDVVKVLGKAAVTVKNKKGDINAYAWELEDLDAYFVVDFDEGGKVWQIEIDSK